MDKTSGIFLPEESSCFHFSIIKSIGILWIQFLFDSVIFQQELQRKLNSVEPLVRKCREKLERVREQTSQESTAYLFADFAFYENIQRNLAGAVEVWLARLNRVQERLSAFNKMRQELHASLAECERVLDSGTASNDALFQVNIYLP